MTDARSIVIDELWRRGHFWNPHLSDTVNQDDLPKLELSDSVVKEAVRSYADLDAERYAAHVAKIHNRAPWNDGEVGPAVTAMTHDSANRCPIPDYAPPPGATFHYDDPDLQRIVERMQRDAERATGGGNWPRCHNVGDYHCAIVQVDETRCPERVRPYLADIQSQVQRELASVGLLLRFVDETGRDVLNGDDLHGMQINIDVEWKRGDGWIGLAIVGRNEGCGSRIWAKFDTAFVGGNTKTEIVNTQTTLMLHEHLHNMGYGHTRGGILNPSLVRGLSSWFSPNDPITPVVKRDYGGQPVPLPDGNGPTPEPPDDSVEKRLQVLAWENRVQQAQIDRLFQIVRSFGRG
jgi:hypothetical protein